MKFNAFISYSHAADGELAPSLQTALHRIGKPLFKFRALSIFRDSTSLSATPHLWGSIVDALGKSDYFILLASPEAAQSEWVKKEVEFWLQNRSIDKVLIGLTDGNILWNQAQNDFDWNQTNCLPELLKERFQSEPLYVDFRAAKHKNDLSYDHPEFRSKAALIAAAIHGKPMNDLIGEDVRIRKKTFRIVYSVIAILVSLSIGLFWFARASNINEKNAKKQESLAIEKKDSLATQLRISDSLAQQEKLARIDADYNANIAKLERDTAIYFGEQANISNQRALKELANNWFVLSHSQDERLPFKAFLMTIKAAETALLDNGQFSLYLNRAIHLSAKLPNRVVNLNVSEGIQAGIFNRSQNIVVLVTDTEKGDVFSLPDGKRLFTPEDISKRGFAESPEFGTDDVSIKSWVNWFHPEPDPDQSGTYDLAVDWNPVTGIISTPVDNGSIDPYELIWRFNSWGDDEDDPDETEIPVDSDIVPPYRRIEALENGTVAIWKKNSSNHLISTKALDLSERVAQAKMTDLHHITFDYSGRLKVWNSHTNQLQWSVAYSDSEGFELSPDHSVVVIDETRFNLADGTNMGALSFEEDPNYEPLSQALTNNGVRTASVIFGWEAGEDLLFTDKDGDIGSNQNYKTDNFMTFLRNGRFCLMGASNSFQIYDIFADKVMAYFYFNKNSRLNEFFAQKLLKRTVDVRTNPKEKAFILRMEGGAEIIVNDSSLMNLELRSATDNALLVTPIRNTFSQNQIIALSSDEQWLASAEGSQFQVWNAKNGYPLTEKVNIEDSIFDIRFLPKNNSVKILTSTGLVIDINILTHWKTKPNWLKSLGPAFTGLTLNETGETIRLSQDELKKAQEDLMKSLKLHRSKNPMINYLEDRLTLK